MGHGDERMGTRTDCADRGHRVRDIERIMSLRLLDDVFMKEVLRDNLEGVQDIIRTLLRRDDIAVIKVETQDELSNLVGHSVRLDVLAQDTGGKFYNIEIQRSGRGAGAKRVRFHLSAVDWHKFPPGAEYEDLAETWIIFITETDLFGRDLPVYTVDRFVRETGEPFNDEGHILYANSAYAGDDAIGRLMAELWETDPEKMRCKPLADRAKHLKGTEGGVESMCRVIEEVRAEGREEGFEDGVRETRERMVDVLLATLSEEVLLHDAQFKGLAITREEIDAARARLGR